MDNSPIKRTVEEWLGTVDYGEDENYIPSEFALQFVNFIKLVNGSEGEENLTPVLHLKMLDQIATGKDDTINMCHRGAAKTTLLGEYLFLYLAVFGEIPDFGKVDLAIYVSDSIDNGVKNMRKNLEFRWENSDFLQEYVPNIKFTDIRWEFNNKDGKRFIVKGYGAKTGVRGAKEMGKRPQLAVLDDLLSDEDARSPTIIATIEDTVYKAIDYALHPERKKIVWSGTPFNANDPLYKAVESGAWHVNVYPVCNKFPCERSEFRGSWEDRFNYDYVKKQYDKAFKQGKLDSFNQELMLRIISDEDRMVTEEDIVWYDRDSVIKNKGNFNFYVTTDFATSEKKSADYSVIIIWAYSANGDWLLADGICKRQLMDANINDLFRLCQKWSPQAVGVEVTGQQGGFIQWVQGEMIRRNIWFTIASENNHGKAGFRPSTNKMERFNVVLPLFKANKIWFPKQFDNPNNALMVELLDELRYLSPKGFKSKHDDACDNVSQLPLFNAWKPSGASASKEDVLDMELLDVHDNISVNSYIV